MAAKGDVCKDCVEKHNKEADGQDVLSDTEARVVLTTESVIHLPIAERLDIITAECVLGMNIFKDIFSAGRDFFGGRSKATQSSLRDARIYALNELRREAASIGADAVVGIDLDYSEISGGNKSMLFLVASGTAVKLEK
ncbi:YbjQ family protein [Marinobacter bryozoorum]|uniref:YbjQ family protein n=1 Tax=Marinobacter bryozoorum TaxID=256324 RepID=UPI002006CBA0|nr:YbjQ family protein [Marinobacter bryozoorum]MCK7544637.1 YbjQ family protein [Marinobacter bryozoorum]